MLRLAIAYLELVDICEVLGRSTAQAQTGYNNWVEQGLREQC